MRLLTTSVTLAKLFNHQKLQFPSVHIASIFSPPAGSDPSTVKQHSESVAACWEPLSLGFKLGQKEAYGY